MYLLFAPTIQNADTFAAIADTHNLTRGVRAVVLYGDDLAVMSVYNAPMRHPTLHLAYEIAAEDYTDELASACEALTGFEVYSTPDELLPHMSPVRTDDSNLD